MAEIRAEKKPSAKRGAIERKAADYVERAKKAFEQGRLETNQRYWGRYEGLMEALRIISGEEEEAPSP